MKAPTPPGRRRNSLQRAQCASRGRRWQARVARRRWAVRTWRAGLSSTRQTPGSPSPPSKRRKKRGEWRRQKGTALGHCPWAGEGLGSHLSPVPLCPASRQVPGLWLGASSLSAGGTSLAMGPAEALACWGGITPPQVPCWGAGVPASHCPAGSGRSGLTLLPSPALGGLSRSPGGQSSGEWSLGPVRMSTASASGGKASAAQLQSSRRPTASTPQTAAQV